LKLLISGSAGFVGSHLCKRFVADGHEVIGIDTTNRSDAWRLEDCKLAEYLWMDLADLRVIPPGADAVVHTAASADVGLTDRSPRHAVHQSISGTVALLEACRHAYLRQIVIISSYSVYGMQPVQPIPEDVVLKPTSIYGAVKASQETIALSYARAHGLPVTVIRSATMYGPFGRATVPVSIFLRKALAGEPITLTGSGNQTRDQTYVGNTVDAIAKILDAPASTHSEIFNIGSGEEVSILNLAEACIRAVNSKSEILHAPERAGEEGRLTLDVSKARRVLGIVPLVPLGQGIALTAEWMQSRGAK